MALRTKKQPLYDQLVDILTEKIEQEYRPGDLMPSERELSERYGLSRTTVRLALQELEQLGMVVRQHGRGTFVADRSAQRAFPTRRSLSSARFSPMRLSQTTWAFARETSSSSSSACAPRTASP